MTPHRRSRKKTNCQKRCRELFTEKPFLRKRPHIYMRLLIEQTQSLSNSHKKSRKKPRRVVYNEIFSRRFLWNHIKKHITSCSFLHLCTVSYHINIKYVPHFSNVRATASAFWSLGQAALWQEKKRRAWGTFRERYFLATTRGAFILSGDTTKWCMNLLSTSFKPTQKRDVGSSALTSIVAAYEYTLKMFQEYIFAQKIKLLQDQCRQFLAQIQLVERINVQPEAQNHSGSIPDTQTQHNPTTCGANECLHLKFAQCKHRVYHKHCNRQFILLCTTECAYMWTMERTNCN